MDYGFINCKISQRQNTEHREFQGKLVRPLKGYIVKQQTKCQLNQWSQYDPEPCSYSYYFFKGLIIEVKNRIHQYLAVGPPRSERSETNGHVCAVLINERHYSQYDPGPGQSSALSLFLRQEAKYKGRGWQRLALLFDDSKKKICNSSVVFA